MTNSGLTAADVLSLTKDGDGFGGVGLIILLFIFLMAISGNGFFGNNTSNGLALADLQASLYNQTQDSNSRAISNQIATLNDSVLNNKYDNAILIKDLSNQMSNSVAAIGNQIANQTSIMTNLFNQQTIDHLREVNNNLHDELSNATQTATITNNILGALSTTQPKPPCYYNCGCNNSLY